MEYSLHNAFLALLMFIPGFGVVWGITSAQHRGASRTEMEYSRHNAVTGYAFASSVAFKSRSTVYISGNIFHHVVGMLEMIAYSIAISRSALLVKTLVKKSNLKRDVVYTAVEVCIMITILYAAGHIEYGIIEEI